MTEHAKIVRGRVIRGEGLGHRFGYPTANLDRRYFNQHPLAKGVYAGRAKLGRRDYRCLIIIGAPYQRPARTDFKIEVFLLNYSGRLLRHRLTAKIIKKLRPIKKFTRPSDLLQQIREDIKTAQKIFDHYYKKHV